MKIKNLHFLHKMNESLSTLALKIAITKGGQIVHIIETIIQMQRILPFFSAFLSARSQARCRSHLGSVCVSVSVY